VNLILITIDCLRADHLSCLGYSKETTPNLDCLASKGLLFSQAISTSPFTPASLISVFTSTYPLMYGGELRVTNRRTTVAQVLKEHGYCTVAFHSNPWLSAYYGFNRGFDTFADSVQEGHYKSLWGKVGELAIRRRIYKKGKLYKILAPLYGAVRFGNPFTEAEVLNREALSWLHDNPNNFFLWLHYMDVHNPYIPFRRMNSPFERYHLFKLNQKAFGDQGSLTPEEINELISLYDDKVSYADEMIGSLLAQLKQNNTLDNTFVIVTADHGQQLMEHGYCGHTSHLYDEVTRVPLIIAGPGFKGQVISQQVSLLDLAPTILDILEIKKPKGFIGNTLVELVDGNNKKVGNLGAMSETPRDKRSLLRMQTKPRLDIDQTKISLRTGKWKYIYANGKQDELYCLEHDPKETHNIIDIEPEIASKLRTRITAHIEFEHKTAPSEEEIIKEKVRWLKSRGL
jgi:arylsulfatase A-like enzyme